VRTTTITREVSSSMVVNSVQASSSSSSSSSSQLSGIDQHLGKDELIKSLSAELDTLRGRQMAHSEPQTDLEALRADLESERARSAGLQAKVDELAGRSPAADPAAEIALLRGKIASLETEKSQLHAEEQRHREALAVAERRHVDMEENLKREISSLRSDIAALGKEKEDLTAAVQQGKFSPDEAAELAALVNKLRVEQAEWSKEKQHLQDVLDAERKAWAQEKSELTAKISTLEAAETDLAQKIAALLEAAEHDHRQIEETDKLLVELSDENDRIVSQLRAGPNSAEPRTPPQVRRPEPELEAELEHPPLPPGTPDAKPELVYKPTKGDEVDKTLAVSARKFGLTKQDIVRIAQGKYKFLGSDKISNVTKIGSVSVAVCGCVCVCLSILPSLSLLTT
jgi:hypothetical protein